MMYRSRMTRTAAVLAAGVLAACGGDNKPANVPAELVDIAEPELTVTTQWSTRIGNGAGGQFAALQPRLDGGRVYVASADGQVQAMDADSGDRLWSVETGLRVVSGPGVADGHVLVGTLDGEVLALDAESGEQRWTAVVDAEVLATPVGGLGRVVARAVDGRVFGLDVTTGDIDWVFSRSSPALTLRGLSDPVVVGSTTLVGLDTGQLVALDTRTGEVDWEQQIREPVGRSELERIVDIDAELLIADGLVFAASYGGELVVLSVASGREIWRRNLQSYSGMVIEDDVVYVTDAAGTVWALDAASGAAVWQTDVLAHRGLTQPAWYRGNLAVADRQGYLHFLSPADGQPVARVRPVRDAVRAAPVEYADTLYVLDIDGRLVALRTEPRTGG